MFQVVWVVFCPFVIFVGWAADHARKGVERSSYIDEHAQMWAAAPHPLEKRRRRHARESSDSSFFCLVDSRVYDLLSSCCYFSRVGSVLLLMLLCIDSESVRVYTGRWRSWKWGGLSGLRLILCRHVDNFPHLFFCAIVADDIKSYW
jgi:hypothetical protein